MKILSLIVLCSAFSLSFAQTTSDIFTGSDYEYTYLGIDFSHAKFQGEFSQFVDAGAVGLVAVKQKYFSGWNNVVLSEREKYNFQEALRKENISYDISSIESINEATAVEDMDSKIVEYSESDIQGFINASEYSVSEGIGIMFFCEFMNKSTESACYHFVMVNLSTKEILLHERMVYPPAGFGLKNYWIKPVYLCIDQVNKKLYKKWKKEYAPK